MGASSSSSPSSSSQLEVPNLETYSLIWLDRFVNSLSYNIKAQEQLQKSISYLLTFDDDQQCFQYLSILSDDDRIILIVSGSFGQTIVPLIASFRHIISIYVYCMDKKTNEQWAQKYSKVKGVFSDLDSLINKIQSDQIQRQKDKIDESLCMNFFKSNIVDEGQSSTALNGQFIHSQLLIECLIRMKTSVNDKNELINRCKQQYQKDPVQLKIVKDFERTYSSNRSLYWYTRQSFLYRLLNRALRVQDIDVLYLFRFFIRDIQDELIKYKCSSPIRVYRSQLISKNEMEKLKNSIGEYVSMNSFFSTSINRQRARAFLFSAQISDHTEQVLFEIDADPHLKNIKPFGNISSISYYPQEEEVLFMIGSIFRLVDIKYDNENIWIIRMILSSDDDNQLQALFQHMKKQLMSRDIDLLSFGHVLRDMGKLDQAEKYFHCFLNQLSDDHSDIPLAYHALGMVADAKGNYELSLSFYNKSLQIFMNEISAVNQINIATSHNSIAIVHRKKGDYIHALESYEKALYIFEQVYGENHPNVAMCLNNMGVVYQEEKNYIKALECHTKALKIRQKHLPCDHPQLGASYNNIGEINRYLKDYDFALYNLNLSLHISRQSLPSLHPKIAMILQNIGLVYEDKGEYQQALSYLEKSSAIYHHPSVIINDTIIEIDEHIKRVTLKLK